MAGFARGMSHVFMVMIGVGAGVGMGTGIQTGVGTGVVRTHVCASWLS
jgi:hypothetical protein